MDTKIAVVAVAYNRVDSLSRLLESLKCAYYSNEVTLIISIDKSKTDSVERYADSFEWMFGNKIVDKHKKNLGLRPHMMSLGKWFEQYDALIVLEDDIVVSKDFYNFSVQAVQKYQNDEKIAGIGLYSYQMSKTYWLPFEPLKDEHDVYFMQYAISWGQIWMKKSWLKFYQWYQLHQDLTPFLNYLPSDMLRWDSRSWLKYHMCYCLDQNKYFVHPYTALSTTGCDAGEHFSKSFSGYQVPLQQGHVEHYRLPNPTESYVWYDMFFEYLFPNNIQNIDREDICIDLHGQKHNIERKRYWLTTQRLEYQVIKQYGVSYRPIEYNVLLNNEGADIFLYDTTQRASKPSDSTYIAVLFEWRLASIRDVISIVGIKSILNGFLSLFKEVIKSK